MTHKMGLAHVTLNQRTGVVASRVLLNGVVQNQSFESTSSVRASGNFLTNFMYNKSNECYFIMKPGTENAKTFDCTERTEATAWIDAWTTSVGENECKHFDATVRPYTNYTANFSYSGEMKTISTPMKCDYTMECWGASGGSARLNGTLTNLQGKGGYTYGEISWDSGTPIYVYVGGKGEDMAYNSSTKKVYQNASGGWNGGGNGTWDHSDDDGDGGGGGATDFRLTKASKSDNSIWNELESLKSRIMVAGGGGGGGYRIHYGGCGGNTTGGVAYYTSGSSKVTITTTTPGSQTSGYRFGQGQNGGNGSSLNDTAAGGGSGYYGATSDQSPASIQSNNTTPAAGGSSFISGHSGCNAIKEDAETNTGGDTNHTGSPNHYSGKVFKNTSMINGDSSMPNYSGSGTMTGNSGNGYARIKFLSVTR